MGETMAIDVEKARAETPGCRHVLHFNNAGAALQPQPVLEAVLGHLRLEGEVGGYEAEDLAESALAGTYASVARLLNCAPDEIALIENATRAWDMAFYALAARMAPGDRVLTAVSEYGSNFIAYLQAARSRGIEVAVVPNDAHGRLSIEALEDMADERIKLIAVTHIPTNGGLVNPAAEIGRIARRRGIPYLLDACQSVGQMPVDVAAIGCDMLSACGRKFLRGPRGTGFLYVRRGLIEQLEPPFLDGHAATWISRDAYAVRKDARRFETWESYVAGRVGLGAAVDYALELGLDAIEERVRRLATTLRERLTAIDGVTVRDLGKPGEQCGIVGFTSADEAPEALKRRLHGRGINVVTSGVPWTLLDMTGRGIDMLVRASVHYYNTEDEIERFCAAVAEGPE
jgi:selenocysteine lyase/cysteine desulfurase